MSSSIADAARIPPDPERRPFEPGRDIERFLAAIVASADDAIFGKTLDGTILSWNAGAERMYGYAPAEIVGDDVHRLAPPDRQEEIDEILDQIRRGERIDHFETERVRRDGTRFPVSLAISPVRDGTGQIIGASTIARDISEQRRLAEAADFQRSLLAAESEASIDGILVVDPHGEVLFTNRRFGEMWGLADAIAGQASSEALLKTMLGRVRDPDAFVARIRDLDASPGEKSRDEVQLRDGRVFDRYSAPVLGDEDRSYGRVWSFRDVTAETILVAQLQAVIGAIDDGAIVFASNGDLVLQNPAARHLLPPIQRFADLLALLGSTTIGGEASSGRAAAGRAAAGHLAPGPATASPATASRVVDLEGEHDLVVDGQARRIVWSTRPFGLDENGGRPSLGRLVLLRDVTNLRDVEASREAFVGVLSHELRTPITTIYGAAKMLQRRQSPMTRTELLGDIEAESDRLYRLVEDLLVLTRIERESLEIADEPMLIGPVVQRIVAAERNRLPDARLEVEIGDALPMVRGEETYVEQILRNLIGNAIKYGPRQGLVRIVVEPSAVGVAVRVLDEGPGIAAGDADRIFELLYRSPKTASQASGSGIGLFVSRRLAEAMGGGVSARARRKRGSEFVFQLAVYHDDEVAGGSPRRKGQARQRPARR